MDNFAAVAPALTDVEHRRRLGVLMQIVAFALTGLPVLAVAVWAMSTTL